MSYLVYLQQDLSIYQGLGGVQAGEHVNVAYTGSYSRFLNWFVPGRSRHLPAAPLRISVLRTNYRRILQKFVYIQTKYSSGSPLWLSRWAPMYKKEIAT